MPADLDETFSSVLEAQAELIQSAAQLGVVHSFDQSPKAMLDQFEKSGGDIDSTFAQLAANAPAVKQAEAKLEAAKRDLAQAELDLRYCDITAEIDGVVTRRNVNPGNYVQVGQNLMAIRSLDEIWVDANFKETQLRDLRIGQPVDLRVDMYGGTHIFKGRVAGFTMGTGSTLALLPPQNATGNFVKVVQRLPVRIDLVDYDADQTPLFIGTSVVPYVHINKPPTGPDAGKFLQAYVPQSPSRWSGRQRVGQQAMTAAAVVALRGSRAAINPWVVAAVVVVPTFMEVLDTTIAVVALRYIAGGLSATVDDGEWVITSYLAANAIILPITGWLIAHLGRRNYFLLSIAVFTLASGLCGMATSLGQLILFRVLQGLAGGGLQPSSQGVLLDAFPVERQGMAMTLFGLAALIAPVVGPTLGGWITDNYSWRWVFWINVPVGLLALAACYASHSGTPTISRHSALELRRRPFSFDGDRPVAAGHRHGLLGGDAQQGPGMGLAGRPVLACADAGDPVRRGPGRADLLGTAPPSPVVNFRPLRERNFGACCIIIFCAYRGAVWLPAPRCLACSSRCSATMR